MCGPIFFFMYVHLEAKLNKKLNFKKLESSFIFIYLKKIKIKNTILSNSFVKNKK